MTLTKYEQRDLNMIRLLIDRSSRSAVRDAVRLWLEKAGDNEQARQRRQDALSALQVPQAWLRRGLD